MKKIISGKQYNTETAKEVGSWANAGNWRDVNHAEETLYLKKTGEYFLFGEGGPASKYAEPVGSNSWTSGCRIMPMTWEEARSWAEKHLSTDDYEDAFGAVAEDDSRITVHMSLSAGAVDTAKRAAAQAGMTLSAYIETLITRN